MTLDLDTLSTAQLLSEARKHLDAWQTLNHILTSAPGGSMDPKRRQQIWETGELHADLAAGMIELARLRLAEDVARNA